MIKEALMYFLDQVRDATAKVDGREYGTIELRPITDPSPSPLGVHTLSGVIDWIKAEGIEPLLIHVVNGKRVRVLSPLVGKWEQRKIYIEAAPIEIDGFPFGRYMPINDFIISLQCCFEDSDAKTKLINLVSHIKGEDVQIAEDDGIAQNVAVENKIHRLSLEKVEPIVELHPFRTFLDIDQPKCRYLIRMVRQKGELPAVGLFSVDGGKWENDAIKEISKYFALDKYIHENGIPIIS